MKDFVWEFAQRDFWITSVFKGPVFAHLVLSKKSKKFAFVSRFAKEFKYVKKIYEKKLSDEVSSKYNGL